MNYFKCAAGAMAATLLVTSCATQPMGPQVAVMPSPNKPFSVFQDDQAICRQYAGQQVGGQAEAANNQAVGGAILGTVLGAGLGAAIGGGRGAAIGAAGGALTGTAIGAGNSQYTQRGIQGQYDIAYSQCMYSRGNQVPGYRADYAQRREDYPPPGNYPPPPGY